MIEIASPKSMKLDAARWHAALELAQRWCDEDKLPAVGLLVGRDGKTTGAHLSGRQTLDADSAPIRDDAIFLIASITKPIVAMGALLLVERGEISLGDRVTEFIPEFGNNGKNGITLRHLMTHTSGLPDMLADNKELRAGQTPLSRFVEGTCDVKSSFPPGRGVQYQSMGFAILGEVITRVSGKSTAEFLRDEFFDPLQMNDTALGVPEDWYGGPQPKVQRIAEIRLPPNQHDANDWNWNSRYWRGLGAPWGGLLTTPADLAQFTQMMMNHGPQCQLRRLSWPANIWPLGGNRNGPLGRPGPQCLRHHFHNPATGTAGSLFGPPVERDCRIVPMNCRTMATRNLDGIRNIDILAATIPEGINAQVAELADALG